MAVAKTLADAKAKSDAEDLARLRELTAKGVTPEVLQQILAEREAKAAAATKHESAEREFARVGAEFDSYVKADPAKYRALLDVPGALDAAMNSARSLTAAGKPVVAATFAAEFTAALDSNVTDLLATEYGKAKVREAAKALGLVEAPAADAGKTADPAKPPAPALTGKLAASPAVGKRTAAERDARAREILRTGVVPATH